MGQKIVGQSEPWYSGLGTLLVLLLTGAGLIGLIVWGNWP